MVAGAARAGEDDAERITLESKDGRLVWRLPKGWEAVEADSEGEIKARLKGEPIYAKVGYEKKGEPAAGRLAFSERLRDRMLGQLKDAKPGALREVKVRGKDAVIFGATGMMDGTRAAYLVIVIEEEEVFVKASSWAPADVAKDRREALTAALSDVAYRAPRDPGANDPEVVLRSADGVLELRLPEGWVQQKTDNPKEIRAQHRGKGVRVATSHDRKAAFENGLEVYAEQFSKGLLRRLSKAESSEAKRGSIEGRKTVAYVVRGESEAGELVCFLTTTEGKERLIKLVVFARPSAAAEHAEEIDKVMRGVREAGASTKGADVTEGR